jgi:hypothetical protein
MTFDMVGKYASCAIFSVTILLVGAFLSLSTSIQVNLVGEKPPFLFALFILIASLFILIGTSYLSYTAWFDSAETEERVGLAMERLAKSYGHFRFLVITNRFFLLWFIRIFYPIPALFSLGLFVLVLLSAF